MMKDLLRQAYRDAKAVLEDQAGRGGFDNKDVVELVKAGATLSLSQSVSNLESREPAEAVQSIADTIGVMYDPRKAAERVQAEATARDEAEDVRGIDLKDLVRVALGALVDDEMAFTAFNITEILREGDPDTRHWQVRLLVYEAMENDPFHHYCSSTVMVGDQGALLYHPAGFDPDLYSGEPVSHDTSAAVDPDDVDEEDDGPVNPAPTRHFSTDGIIYLPKSVTRNIPGGALRAMAAGFDIIVSTAGDIELKTDAKGNTRLTRRQIKELGLEATFNCDAVTIEGEQGKATIRPVK